MQEEELCLMMGRWPCWRHRSLPRKHKPNTNTNTNRNTNTNANTSQSQNWRRQFSLDPSYRGISCLQVENMSFCLFVCLSSLWDSNIGPLYHPRIMSDPTNHILMGKGWCQPEMDMDMVDTVDIFQGWIFTGMNIFQEWTYLLTL